jgi:hypothetical protein
MPRRSRRRCDAPCPRSSGRRASPPPRDPHAQPPEVLGVHRANGLQPEPIGEPDTIDRCGHATNANRPRRAHRSTTPPWTWAAAVACRSPVTWPPAATRSPASTSAPSRSSAPAAWFPPPGSSTPTPPGSGSRPPHSMPSSASTHSSTCRSTSSRRCSTGPAAGSIREVVPGHDRPPRVVPEGDSEHALLWARRPLGLPGDVGRASGRRLATATPGGRGGTGP